jgi:hypothetical protein
LIEPSLVAAAALLHPRRGRNLDNSNFRQSEYSLRFELNRVVIDLRELEGETNLDFGFHFVYFYYLHSTQQ